MAQASFPRRIVSQVWREHGRRLLALWALILVAYSNSFHTGMVFDNVGVILHDPRIRDATARNIGAILTQGYWYQSPNTVAYRPFVTLSYLFNYAVPGGGANPVGYHWINFLLHVVNVSLVYALGLLVFTESLPGLAVAGIWALHPLLTESVTNIIGRADELAAFGVLAGFLCYCRWISADGRHKRWWLAALVAAQAVGLFSKENAAVLPGILLLYDLLFSDRIAWRTRVKAYAALLVPIATLLLARILLPFHTIIGFQENPLIAADFWTARLTAVKVIGKFLWLFIWPARLSADYSYNAFPLFGWNLTSWEDQKTLLALAVAIGLIALAVICRRNWKPVTFFIGFFFVAIMPTANLIVLIGSIMGERFMYLPSVGLAGCLVAIVRRISSDWRLSPNAIRIATALACLTLAARTYARNSDWRDELSLWSSAIIVCPNSARAHMNMGLALSTMPGRLADAIAEYQIGVKIGATSALGHYNFSQLLGQAGRFEDAIAENRAALKIQPDSVMGHYNLGLLLEQTEGWPDAIPEFQTAVRAQPDFALAHNHLGNLLARLPGRETDAMAEWKAAIESDADLVEAHYNLGNALSRSPDHLGEAIAEYRSALRRQPAFAQAHNNLANALAQTPNGFSEAIREWQEALRIQPGLTQAHVNLGTALAEIPGELPDAIAELELAQKQRPDPRVQQILNQLRKRQQ